MKPKPESEEGDLPEADYSPIGQSSAIDQHFPSPSLTEPSDDDSAHYDPFGTAPDQPPKSEAELAIPPKSEAELAIHSFPNDNIEPSITKHIVLVAVVDRVDGSVEYRFGYEGDMAGRCYVPRHKGDETAKTVWLARGKEEDIPDDAVAVLTEVNVPMRYPKGCPIITKEMTSRDEKNGS